VTVHVVLPNEIDDPTRPSGGNAYDRRLCDGLAAAGRTVREHAVPGGWPTPTPAERRALADRLAALPDGALVLVDGLVGSCVPDVLGPEATRLRLVVLVHMPLDDEAERRALTAAAAVVTTSAWTRDHLVRRYGLAPDRIHVAPPGVDPAPLTAAHESGTRLLCVAAVQPHKGHDVLVQALTTLRDHAWTCLCIGALSKDPNFAARVNRDDPRIRFVGPRTGADLDAAYARADLLVLPSRTEAYGMVVTEALARGIPVIASDVGGVSEALGCAPDGTVPGELVPPGDPAALGAALRAWLTEPDRRSRIRSTALVRRKTLTGWSTTATLVSDALSTVVTEESADR
jgi:glycosyltransferase involved in cell wall biosynthesis